MLPNQSAERASTDSPDVSITQLGPRGSDGSAGVVGEDVIAMLVEASASAALCDVTYLPKAMDAAQARAYCASREGFVIREDHAPIGVLIIHQVPRPGDGVTLPPRCAEIEQWVLPRFRGRGLWRRAWPAIRTALAARFLQVAAVCWVNNHAVCRSLRACGFAHLGRSFWDWDGESGWCEVFVYDLRDPRTPPSASQASGQSPPE